MGRTERLELRLDEDFIERIDTWMEETGKASSRSDAVRQLVDIGLSTMTGKSIHLTDGDKLNFMMLRDIVKHLKIKDTETDVELVAESLYGGHYWAPIWEMQGLFHKHADQPADVSLVVDTLDMWDFIEGRIEKLSPDEVEKLKAANHGYLPKFAGFDGNNESTLMGIARFLVEKMDRFSRFKKRDFNSHAPTAARYRRMTTAFEPVRATLGPGRDLNVDQIIELLKVER
ncbi:YfbU family protein [Noviherbaspirillum sp. CPCC 100848]|uniref:YfbU family protein n=1 Tax=Noviherbaspirillum album TaxID=3080276 RepID=A0ABU6JGK5_9BURK|nr:YfbU family protein [Noviherbaspirillum sp. CPCC 100848]MEC4722794.1 YfbU family protein [Noviherbaspirillum sp. CPCC 100848]